MLEQERALKETAFFLCGGERLVSRLKRDLFMKGANLKQIRSDVLRPRIRRRYQAFMRPARPWRLKSRGSFDETRSRRGHPSETFRADAKSE